VARQRPRIGVTPDCRLCYKCVKSSVHDVRPVRRLLVALLLTTWRPRAPERVEARDGEQEVTRVVEMLLTTAPDLPAGARATLHQRGDIHLEARGRKAALARARLGAA